jgi:hypothetical protein
MKPDLWRLQDLGPLLRSSRNQRRTKMKIDINAILRILAAIPAIVKAIRERRERRKAEKSA